ncbi:hypothetical protein DFH06DRAFT_1323562 [Mycena polygramma]|nr:hypothetical protein DFH06DRAFT_1323562 [Mycena polygramma]
MARVRSAQHPRRFCATIIFLLPVRTAATRTRALRAFAAHLGLLALGGGKNSTGPPPAETGWDLYLPNLERARARQGSVLQPFSLSTRTCGCALTFPEVDASSAPTNGPRFKYTLPSLVLPCQTPLVPARPASISATHGLRPQRITFVSSFWFLGVEVIFQRSTTKSTSLAFARQPTTTHSVFIFRRRQTSESSFISSHRSRPRLAATVLDMHMQLLAAIIFDLIIQVPSAVASLRNPAATLLLPALVLPCQTKLKASFL